MTKKGGTKLRAVENESDKLTPGEAGRLAEAPGYAVGFDHEDIARQLLPCRLLTYEREGTERENPLNVLEARLGVYCREDRPPRRARATTRQR